VPQAAQALGITEGAIRGRLKRGTLRSHREAGTVYVVLEGSPSAVHRDESVGESPDQSELLEELRRTNELLRDVITTRDEEIRRRDTIIMNMTEAMKALSPPAPEDSSEAARESPESSGPTGELEKVREELGTERTRREMAESTLREGMNEERQRREEAERERDDLRRELYALREAPEATETAEEQQGRGEDRSSVGEAQEGARRPWWRRMFGG
jgi:DNA repair exonuclease SbcCD ATPase subunit